MEKYDYTLHPDAQKLIPRKGFRTYSGMARKRNIMKNIRTLQLFLLPPEKNRFLWKAEKKKAEPHFDQQSVYQEPGYHDFPDDFSSR